MSRTSDNPFLYHTLLALGWLGLIGWFALMREVGFMTWLAAQGPTTHTGALNLLAIMLWMLPALLLWKYYLRWVNRRLNVRGRYYEDSYYGSDTPADPDKPNDSPAHPPTSATKDRSDDQRP